MQTAQVNVYRGFIALNIHFANERTRVFFFLLENENEREREGAKERERGTNERARENVREREIEGGRHLKCSSTKDITKMLRNGVSSSRAK